MQLSPGFKKCGVAFILIQHIVYDLVHIVSKTSKLHAALTEMPELMSHYRFEFAYIDTVDQSKSYLKIFLYRQKHAPETGVIKNRCINGIGDKYFFREGCVGFFGKRSYKCK